jgi:hypothetical protein
MTRYDQLFCATHRIHIPDEDVTELAPDDFALIRYMDRVALDASASAVWTR